MSDPAGVVYIFPGYRLTVVITLEVRIGFGAPIVRQLNGRLARQRPFPSFLGILRDLLRWFSIIMELTVE